MTYSARSSARAVATASAVGSTVTVTAVAQGSATITVTATDEDNLSTTQTFNVTVTPAPPPEPTEQAPVAVSTIGSRTLTVGAAPTSIDVADYFNDPDGQALTYSARSSARAVATASAAGSTVTVTAVAQGSATITVTATDEDNLTATQTFGVTVNAALPPEPTEMACVSHSASQILGDWDASGNTAQDDEVYIFRANGTYQRTYSLTSSAPGLDQSPVTRTVRINGTYSYVAETCLLTWEPGIANITHFVAWNGPDQFSTKFSPGGFIVLTTFDRR